MRALQAMLVAPVIVTVGPEATRAQEPAPAQPPAEVNVAQEFQRAAPELFREWLGLRPEVLRRVGLGQRMGQRPECHGRMNYFQFLACVDAQAPVEYRIDVTKTDSVLTSFLGHLYVPVKETCTIRNVVPTGMTWGEKATAALEPSCVGKTYDECIAAGGKPAPKLTGSVCTGGPGFSFPFEHEVHLTYRWSQGRWEFQEEKADKPVPPNSGER